MINVMEDLKSLTLRISYILVIETEKFSSTK